VSRARAVRKNKNSNFCSAGVCTSRLYFSVILSSSCFVLAARNTVQLKPNKQKKKKKKKKKKEKKKSSAFITCTRSRSRPPALFIFL